MNKQTPKFALLYLVFAAAAWGQCAAPYGYQRAITVNSGQVTGTQTNFPMLVLNPTSSLKTVGNGGHVANSNGYDIIFVNSGGSMLPFQLVGHGASSTTYSSSTGNAEFWVNVGSMATGSTVYMCYGAPSVTTYQGNDSGTWNSNFKLVQHLSNGTTLDVSDSTGINSVTNHSIAPGAGQVDGAGSGLSGGSNGTYLALGSNGALQTSVFTYSAWIYYNGGTSTIFGSSSDAGGPQLRVDPHVVLLKQDTSAVGFSTGAVTTGVWTHVAVTYDSTGNYVCYLNGVPSGSGTNLQTFAFNGFYLGTRAAGGGTLETFNGSIDEPHISNSVRSANWIAAEYNNQSNPGAFYSVGSESATSRVLMSSLPAAIPNGHAGNITLALTGVGTNWSNANTVFTVAGVTNVTKVSQNVTSPTAATLAVTTGAGTGALNVAESVTGTAWTMVNVGVPSFSIDMVRGNLNSIQSLTLTGINTVWSQEAAGLFSVVGGTGVSIGTPTITSNTTGTVVLTVGTSAGTLTITDTSTGKTATFAAGGAAGPSGCAVVFVQ